jgi:hypothetical protein
MKKGVFKKEFLETVKGVNQERKMVAEYSLEGLANKDSLWDLGLVNMKRESECEWLLSPST